MILILLENLDWTRFYGGEFVNFRLITNRNLQIYDKFIFSIPITKIN